ncbi:MAG: DotA/TraY family protein, partial [Proteobacteria bacterium]|nr:DotA/TraY family protein [Pseudomonadota bacterium]
MKRQRILNISQCITFLLLLIPSIVLAATDPGNPLNFRPPATDMSVVFLGNLFGIVDGILHGTSSQIMGAMFSVFNAAILSLGGILLMYTLIIGTLNTAHKGEALGEKWHTMWVPIRSAMAVALLIPKASGYCLMQIFVMWVVVQGVGAADKTWNAALDYLGRGGVIIQHSLQGVNGNDDKVDIAKKILNAQVCMHML